MNEMIKEEQIDFNQLLKAVDFFSQNLSFEQIVSYGYNFLHELLELKSSAIYVLEENSFELKSQMHAGFMTPSIPNDHKMKAIATKFGRALQKELPQYFEDTFLKQEKISVAIPILVKDHTVAIIFSRNEEIDLSCSATAAFFNGINQLINKASESARNFEQYKIANAALDRKIFNLLFINHSSRALMSEINVSKLYALCIDVIRELTASSVTSFGLYDAVRETIVLKGFKDILSFNEYYCEIDIYDRKHVPSKIVYCVKDDYEALASLFKNPEEFKALKATYVVLIVKEEILGYVTIGETVSSRTYTPELLHQVESLVSSIYIAIKNAHYFETINKQKLEIESQLKLINDFNSVIKNINTCDTVEELSNLSLRSMGFGFGLSKGMIVIKVNGKYKVSGLHGFESSLNEFVLTEDFERECLDQTYFNLIAQNHSYINSSLMQDIGESNCFVSVPLLTDEISLDKRPLGFILIFDTKEALKKNQVVLLETLSVSVTPIIKQLLEKSFIKARYIPNQEQAFIDDLSKAISNRDEYYTDFKVYFKSIEAVPFEKPDLCVFETYDIHYFSNTVLHISYEEDLVEGFDGSLDVFTLETFIEEFKTII